MQNYYPGKVKKGTKLSLPLFFASDDASCITGQVIHPNGGEIVNG